MPDTLEQPATIPVTAGSGGIPIITGGPRPREITLSDVARICATAPGQRPGEYITAQLADITSVGNEAVMRPVFVAEIKGLIEYGRPTINAIDKAPLPPAGMRIEWPVWQTLPTVDKTTGEKVLVPTGPVTVTTDGVDVDEWAGAADISLRLAQRSNPSFMEAYFRGCAEIYARKTNLDVITKLLAGAAVVAPAATFLDSLEAIVASFDPTKAPGGSLFVGMSWDVGATMIGVTAQNGPAYWDASINFSSLPQAQTAGGINIYVDRQLPAKTVLAGFSNAVTWYEDPTAPAEIRVVDVSLLGVDAGVYGYAALGANFPLADTVRKITYTTLPTLRDTSQDQTPGEEPKVEASSPRKRS